MGRASDGNLSRTACVVCTRLSSSPTFSVDFDDFQPHAAGSASQSQQKRRGERSRDVEEHLGEAARTSSQRSGRGRDGQHSAEQNEQGLLPGPSARLIESRGSGKRLAPQTGGSQREPRPIRSRGSPLSGSFAGGVGDRSARAISPAYRVGRAFRGEPKVHCAGNRSNVASHG
jgi:hypothetical protein